MTCHNCYLGYRDTRDTRELCNCSEECRECGRLVVAGETIRGYCGECAASLVPFDARVTALLLGIIEIASRRAVEGRDTVPCRMTAFEEVA